MADQPQDNPKPSDPAALAALAQLGNRIGYVYGSETIGMILYALIRRERPVNVVEFGTGLGVSTWWMAQALKENGDGTVWSIDDGSHWADIARFRAFVGQLDGVAPFDALDFESLDYPSFLEAVTYLLEQDRHIRFLHETVDFRDEAGITPARWPFLASPIDMVFLDIDRTPESILDSLYFLLPSIADGASIFIDSVPTSIVANLFLENLVDQLNTGKMPRRFMRGDSPERRQRLHEVVVTRRFRLMPLIERSARDQNSTAWIKIEPVDFVPYPPTRLRWV